MPLLSFLLLPFLVAPSQDTSRVEPTEELGAGRILDATSGTPVPGAIVETWTETIDEHGLARIGAARSDPDGTFRVAIARGGVRAEKVLVRSPGYLTYPGTLADLDEILLMPRSLPAPRLWVVDLEDRPIRDAHVTATYSCAHDVPPFDVVTGPDGVAVLEDFGLQDHLGDLRVQADGFALRASIPGERIAFSLGTGVVRLARQERVLAFVRAADGSPSKNTPLRILDDGLERVVWTDGSGGLTFQSPIDSRELVIRTLASGEGAPIHVGPLPRGGAWDLRAGTWPEGTPLGRLHLHAPAFAPRVVHLFHSDGWTDSAAVPAGGDTELLFPEGTVRLVAGGAFTGWEKLEETVHLRAGQTEDFEPVAIPERRIRIRFDPETTERLVVQSGASSLELDPRTSPVELPVPEGRLVVLAEGDAAHRCIADPSDPPVEEVDLTSPESLLESTPALPTEAPHHVTVEVAGPASATLSARGPEPIPIERLGPTSFRVTAPPQIPLLLHASADDFVDCWQAVPPGEETVTLHPAPRP